MRIPGGVILLAILPIVGGVFGILWGMVVGRLGGMTWLIGAITFSETIRSWGESQFLGGSLGICGVLFQIIIGFGLMGGRSGAWWLAAVARDNAYPPSRGVVQRQPVVDLGLIAVEDLKRWKPSDAPLVRTGGRQPKWRVVVSSST